MVNSPVLLLNTTGRTSGRRRTTPLLYLQDDDSYAIVASNGGTAAHPAWFYNLRARPEATVEVGGRELRVRAEEAGPSERERLWARLVAMYPPYEDYQEKTDREIPVLLLRPSEHV
jgi:deazaflavin-dependent oxidoreductase (nitroreductase family)